MANVPERRNSKRGILYYDFILRDASWQTAYSALLPKVQEQIRPWIFSANVNGRREPKSMPEQLVDFKHEVRRVYAAFGKDASDPSDSTPMPTPSPEPVPEEKPEPEKPQASGKAKKETEREKFWNEWNRLRRWIKDRAATTGASEVDSLESMRPVLEARRAIEQGISALTMISAMTLHWSQDTKQSASVQPVDFSSLSEPVADGKHSMSGYIVKLLQARIPVMLIGPAGSGKSTAIRHAAEHLGMAYGETPLTAGATPSWLLGRNTLEGYKLSHFLECYSAGGVFNFEEIDAADPNMLIVVNNALAIPPGEDFFNPVNGESYTRHENFMPAATANTFGLGANSMYTGRERLDFATVDRFRMGRVLVNLDEELTRSLMFD